MNQPRVLSGFFDSCKCAEENADFRDIIKLKWWYDDYSSGVGVFRIVLALVSATPAQPERGVTLSDLLNKPWSQAGSFPFPALAFIFVARTSRIEYPHLFVFYARRFSWNSSPLNPFRAPKSFPILLLTYIIADTGYGKWWTRFFCGAPCLRSAK